jgi:glycosyltransferase involved in cell wall biosynthesis
MMSRKADLTVNADRSRARLQRTVYRLERTPLWLQNALSIKEPIPAASDKIVEKILGRARCDGEKIVIYPTLIGGRGSRSRQAYELVQAMSILPQSFTAVLFGTEGEEYARCMAFAQEHRIAERVRFLKPVSFGELLGYVRNSDFGAIFYSDEESSGYFMCNADKLSLYAACRVPYVASQFPNLEALTYKLGLGLCCDSSDPSDIAGAFSRLDAQFPAGGEARSRIRKVFEDELCLERNIGALIECMDKL